MATRVIALDVDMSELRGTIAHLRAHTSDKLFARAMYRTFKETGRHVGAILKQDLPNQYYVKAAEIGQVVQKPIVNMAGMNVACRIPLKGARKSIGGSFSASGSAHGWQSVHKKYRVTARIVKGAASKLPAKMDSYGGMPPFRNIPSNLGKATFTRTGKGRFPIKSVVGIAIPQMPMNRSAEEVEKDILDFTERRLMHYIEQIMSR